MGRRIYDNEGEFVWKYSFGGQPSEMHRIADELGIGVYNLDLDADQGKLTLVKSDMEDLTAYVRNNMEVVNDLDRGWEKASTTTTMKDGTKFTGASFDSINELKSSVERKHDRDDIYFPPMCKAILDKAEDYFKRNPTKPYVLDDEF
jgi:hypothetical protein